jgi:hypothetical protein
MREAVDKKTRADRPWVDLELPCQANTIALFAIATTRQVGNGRTTQFWTDRWLHWRKMHG